IRDPGPDRDPPAGGRSLHVSQRSGDRVGTAVADGADLGGRPRQGRIDSNWSAMFCDPADTTRDRLLDTAERCFAAYGYQATTMRTVTTEAAANIAAVNYHFGSKHALLEA